MLHKASLLPKKLKLPNPTISVLGYIFSAMLIIVLSVVCYAEHLTSTEIMTVDKEWRQLDEHPVHKLDLLGKLRETIGYGGFIHNYNNFLVRKDRPSLNRAYANLRQADDLIEKYHIHETDPKVQEALNDISSTLENYQSTLIQASRLVKQGRLQQDMGDIAMISDVRAIRAFDVLQQNILEANKLHRQSVDSLMTNIKNNTFRRTTLISFLLLLTIPALLIFIQARISGPLQRIIGTIRKYSDGHFNISLPELDRKDEIGQIARQLDVWRRRASGNAELHRELERYASTMDLMNAITVAANNALNKNDAFRKCLKLVCEFTHWEIGFTWEPAQNGDNQIASLEHWVTGDKERFIKFIELTGTTTYEFGEGLPGHVFNSSEIHRLESIKDYNTAPRLSAADQSNLVSAVGIPVTVCNKVAIVLEFFSSKDLKHTTELTEILTHIGTQMSRVAERAMWADEALKHQGLLQERVDKATEELRKNAQDLEKALHKEQELSALQREFVSMVSHEFRTPLAIIDGAAQKMLRKKSALEEQEVIKRIDRIRSAVTSMTGLMESTLSAARMEAGRLQVKIGDCDISTVIKAVCERSQEISEEHNITVQLKDLPATIKADEDALEQILTNLLSNAVKYSPGAPDIHVICYTEGDDIVISVSDKGLGIDEDELPKLFTRFFRAKTSTGIAGTGIGLNLIKMLIEEHDGSIEVESKKGEGSTFQVRLPADGPKIPKTKDNSSQLSEVA